MIFSLYYYFDKLWPVFIAVGVTQVLVQKFIEMRKPKLLMLPEGTGTSGWNIGNSDGTVSVLKNHIWRIKVQQSKIQKCFGLLVKSREYALQCKADLSFYDSNDRIIFMMQGRWANTPEPSLLSPLNQQEKLFYPDRIDIGYHASEPLDCLVQYDDDENTAYGWNNESYWYNGKNEKYKLENGTYKVEVKLSGLNFPQLIKKFDIVISNNWMGTSLTIP